MSKFREVNDDILKEWFEFRDESLGRFTSEEDQKHSINFEDIAKNILRNVPEQNKKYVNKQLDLLDENYLDYIFYWDEKYYRNGFVDGVKLITNIIKKYKRVVSPFIFFYLQYHLSF